MDKRQEAAELYKKIIKLDTTRLSRPYSINDVYGRARETHQYVVACKINGLLYMRLNDMPSDGKNFIKNLINNGMLCGNNIIHGFYKKTVNTFIEVVPLLKKSDELIRYVKEQTSSTESYERIILMLKEDRNNVVDNVIPFGRIIDSEDAFVCRTQLLTEIRRENKRNKEEVVEEKTDNERLRDLVMQIEAMGWHVILELKKDA